MPPVLSAIVLFGAFAAAKSEATTPQKGPAAEQKTVTESSKNPSSGAGTAARTDATAESRPVYSEDQYASLYDTHAAPAPAKIEEPFLDPSESVIELEPYVVEGDGGLMMARFRRYWDLGPASIQKRVAELDPELGQQIDFSGRASDNFFSSQSPGGPTDRQEMFPVPTETLVPISRVVIDALKGDENRP